MAETKLFRYEGKLYRLDSSLSIDEAKTKIQNYLKENPTTTTDTTTTTTTNNSQQVSTNEPIFSARFEDTTPDESIYDEDLIKDEKFIEASKIIYRMNRGLDWGDKKATDSFGKSDEDAAKYGIEMMGFFNYNLPKMAVDAARIHGASESQKRAFLYLMESYDDLGISLAGTGRFFKGVLSDPTTYAGLATFGLVSAGGVTAKIATKEGLKSLLQHSLKAGMYTGAEGAVYAATDNVARQVVRTSVTGEEIDTGEVGQSALIGFGLGKALGTSVTFGTKYATAAIKGKKSKVKTDEVSEEITEEISEEVTENLSTANKIIDDTSPEKINTKMNDVLVELDKVAPSGKIIGLTEDGTQSLTKLEEVSNSINEVLLKASAKSPDEIADFLNKSKMGENQQQVLQKSSQTIVDRYNQQTAELVKLARKENLTPTEVEKIRNSIDKIEKLKAPVDSVYIALSKSAARRLRQTQKSTTTGEGRGLSIANLMADEGLSRSQAEVRFLNIIDTANKKADLDVEVRNLNTKIDEANSSGRHLEAKELRRERDLLVAEIKDEVLSQSLSAKVARGANVALKGVNEVIIGNVFSPKTIMLNTVPSTLKTFYKPFMNNLMRDGLTRKALRQMASEYGSIRGIWKTALRSGVAAFRYERAVLTGDTARFLESYNVIPKKYGGGVVRFFPRLLLATDAMFEQVLYRQFVVGDATARALEDAAVKKLKGKDLDNYVNKKVKEAIDNAYDDAPNAAELLTDEAVSRGAVGRLGKSVDKWVSDELAKNGDLMKSATNKAGKDYTLDALFKRDFSGESSVSKMAKGYEGFINRHPYMRLVGQLFFRTPIRVFEEGFRLTPGLQMVMPNFMKDLRGGAGVPIHRQVRAQGEALTSLAIVGSIYSMYATGNITGAQGRDYKIRRQGENAGGIEPYTIIIGDSEFNYRNFDPFSTPIKIMVNALEGLDELAYRTEQGEHVGENEYMHLYDKGMIALTAILQSIRDANLFAGANAILELGEDAMKEDNEGEFIKFIGEKVQTAVPNTWYKLQMLDHPVLNDPENLGQYFMSRVNPNDSTVPKQYTALGRPRTLSNPMGAINLFSTTSEEQRRRGKGDKELEIEQYLYVLARANNTHFTAPYKHKLLPDVDLRTEMTRDGKETLYDRWMRYTYEGKLKDALYPFTKSKLPIGVPSSESIAVKNVKNIINTFREVAMIKLLNEEAAIQRSTEMIVEKKLKATGTDDSTNLPFNVLRK